MRKGILLLVIVVIIVGIVLGVYYGRRAKPSAEGVQAPAGRVIKIGAILPLTGNLAFLGQPEAAALKVAIDEINSSHNQKVIEAIIEDSKGQPKDGASAAQKLINIDKVDVGMVSTSVIANTVAPIFHSANIPLITICSDNTIAKKYPNCVNIYENIATEQKVMASYLLKEGITSLSVIRVNAQIMEEGIKLLRSFLGGKCKIIEELVYELGTTDFKNIVAKVKQDPSQAVYIMGYGPEYPSIVKTIREMGVSKRLFGFYTFLSDPARAQGTDIYNGLDFTSFTITPQEIAQTSFGKGLTKVLGRAPGPFMDYFFVYEAVKIFFDVAQKDIKNFPQVVRGKRFPSLLGTIEIGSDGNAVVPMAIATYSSNGEVTIKWRPE